MCFLNLRILVSQVEAILDKDGFTLEELLDEDEIIQECKSLNGRLLNLYALLTTLSFWERTKEMQFVFISDGFSVLNVLI